MSKITIHTDGAARGNPGPAGWGAIIQWKVESEKLKAEGKESKMIEIGGRADHATNNMMELTGPIEALKYLKTNNMAGEVEIVSDSKYVILGITEWIGNWIKNGWRNAAKKPVLNRELWEALHALNQEFKPKWTYVKGHADNVYNERADVIATSFADKEPIDLKK